MASGFRRIFILLIIQSIPALTYTQQKRSYNFPFRDPLRNNEEPIKKQKAIKELAICSRCNNMFRLSETEFQNKKSEKQFCIRLLQIQRCIRKLKKDNPQCHSISIMALNTGVYIKKRYHRCSDLDISPNDIVNIFKEIKKTKVSQAELCKFRTTDHNLTEQKHCGIFGDPHIKTFSNVRQTCIVEGAWALLDNDHMAIQVTNEILQTTETTSATATTKISVIFKEVNSKCITQKIYEATSNYLPNVFKDGSYFTGPKGCRTEVLKETSDEISIRSCSLATTIIIRRVGKYLTFNIQTPFLLANKSRGLCSDGCPSSEQVDYKTYFENHIKNTDYTNFDIIHNTDNRLSIDDRKLNSIEENNEKTFDQNNIKSAMKICENSNLTDFYLDSCVFDLLTTGDQQFSKAAMLAMYDAKLYDPKLRLRRENSIILTTSAFLDKEKRTLSLMSNSRTLYPSLILLITFIYLTVCINR